MSLTDIDEKIVIYSKRASTKKKQKKRKSYKTLFKGSDKEKGKGRQRKKPAQRFEISHNF